jgi:hypothetical protein
MLHPLGKRKSVARLEILEEHCCTRGILRIGPQNIFLKAFTSSKLAVKFTESWSNNTVGLPLDVIGVWKHLSPTSL